MHSGVAIPEKQDILGDHLYSLIVSLDVSAIEAAQLTGMLLEMGNEEVLKMLQDKQLLQRKMKEAQTALKRHAECKGFENEALAEKLYKRIESQEQDNCAKLTGMLLELDCSTIEELLSSKKDLETAINKAKICLDNAVENHTSIPETEMQRIGEELFHLVSEIHPAFAAKITGMLLEMKLDDLNKLLNSPKHLREKVNVSYQALMKTCS